jgi:hypothetical protein
MALLLPRPKRAREVASVQCDEIRCRRGGASAIYYICRRYSCQGASHIPPACHSRYMSSYTSSRASMFYPAMGRIMITNTRLRMIVSHVRHHRRITTNRNSFRNLISSSSSLPTLLTLIVSGVFLSVSHYLHRHLRHLHKLHRRCGLSHQ